MQEFQKNFHSQKLLQLLNLNMQKTNRLFNTIFKYVAFEIAVDEPIHLKKPYFELRDITLQFILSNMILHSIN